MAFPYVLQGDVAAAVIKLLEEDSNILAFSPVPVFRKSMIGFSEGARYVVVSPEGGYDAWTKEIARVDIDCYAEDINVCLDITKTTKAVIYAAQGTNIGYGVFLLNVGTDVGITQLQDKETETPRFLMSLRLSITPTATV